MLSKNVRQKTSWVFVASLQNNPLLCLGSLGKRVFLTQGPIMQRTHYLWLAPSAGTTVPVTHTHAGRNARRWGQNEQESCPCTEGRGQIKHTPGPAVGKKKRPERYSLVAWHV